MFLDFFEEVYVINLPKRQDRREFMTNQLNRTGIPFTLFSATEDQNGVIGLLSTMKRLLWEIIQKGQRNVIILEDDAKFLVNNPAAFIKEVLPQLPSDYHLFYFGLNLLTVPKRISENILKIDSCYSTHAIAYSLEGAKLAYEMLMAVPPVAYDIFIRDNVLTHGRSYCTYPMLATQNESYSDIEKKVPNWGELMAMTFAMHTKNMPLLKRETMANEVVKCGWDHQIDGKTPIVDSSLFQVQNPDLLGKTCDCGRFVYSEGKCPTCGGDRWKVMWTEKEG